MSLFERALSVAGEETEFRFTAVGPIPWLDFELNPRRLRGSDFLMRWSQGVWSEKILTQVLEKSERFFALPYGPSGVAPENDVRAYELYFERLEKAGLGKLKRPDLLVFRNSDKDRIQKLVEALGGEQELPFTPEEDHTIQEILKTAIVAIECENSLWRARQMPGFNQPLKPQKWLNGRLGLPKTTIVPTIIVKEEDRKPLLDWQEQRKVPIHIWHTFYDLAYGISLNELEILIADGRVQPRQQIYQEPRGITTTKIIYNARYYYAYALAQQETEPKLVAASITDKNGHILPYVRFEGGSFLLEPESLEILGQLSSARPGVTEK